jgi:hypothetical protein
MAIMRKGGNWYVKSAGRWHWAGTMAKAVEMMGQIR